MSKLFSDEQDEFIRSNAKGLFNQELADLINNRFGLNVTAAQLKSYKKNHQIKSGVTGHFKKGHVPSNKGKKYPGQTNRTTFKKGQVPINYRPVGSERVNADGYLEVKVADPNKWRSKQVVVWEEAHGPIQKGHCVIFLDGDKQNITLENLQLITRSQLIRLNQHHLIKNDADLTKTGIVLADLYSKIGERKKNK